MKTPIINKSDPGQNLGRTLNNKKIASLMPFLNFLLIQKQQEENIIKTTPTNNPDICKLSSIIQSLTKDTYHPKLKQNQKMTRTTNSPQNGPKGQLDRYQYPPCQ